MLDALWQVMMADGNADIARMLIFLPSRRAVRTVEKMIVERSPNRAAILPRMVALGEGADEETDDDVTASDGVISDTMRLCVLTRLLAADANVGRVAAALPIARDLIRMTDYLENEGIDIADIDWNAVVGEKYAAHFQAKAAMLNIISGARALCGAGVTRAAKRNSDIRAWIDVIKNGDFSRVIVCGSTGSVPATADLMAAVARLPNGRIILSGKISGRAADMECDTNPYNSEYKFLTRIGLTADDVNVIDVGASAIDFFNHAFGNVVVGDTQTHLPNVHLIEAPREAAEAAAAAEIAARAVAENKSVLIITPDAAGNARLRTEFEARALPADFSGGVSAAMSPAGRAILNILDDWIERGGDIFEKNLSVAHGRLIDLIGNVVDDAPAQMRPVFDVMADDYAPIWDALAELSDCITAAGIELDASAARAFVADCLSGVSMRPPMDTDARICVLGTIESRMQTADVVILTGLNDGMFPARGYENAWLPQAVARQIGLPPADRKVSLMSLDFMNLSCGADVYWLRSLVAGGVQTTESRFLSRVAAHRGVVDMNLATDILDTIARCDAPAPNPLNPGRAAPPADWSDVYVTELELLIHNPYAFYARHILRLRPMDDWWAGPDARTFGNLVHDVIEHADGLSSDAIVARLDDAARNAVGDGSVLYHFWHRRFIEMAPVIVDALQRPGRAEIPGSIRVPVGDNGMRTIRARADRVCDGMVVDIKTGAAPSKKQLMDGTMPQLPLEAHMLRTGGFGGAPSAADMSPEMMFLQLRSGDARAIVYDADTTAQMISAALDKVDELFRQYTAGGAEYEYRKTNDRKYQAYDDLARPIDI